MYSSYNGVCDIVSDGEKSVTIENGTKMLSNVTGTGCMTTALVGGYLGAYETKEDLFIAAVSGIVLWESVEKLQKKELEV